MDGYDQKVQTRLDEAMPWVGLCIAAFSGICTLMMAADVFIGFQHNLPWFPCKYFSMNATSMTLLAMAMKLPMDLNTEMQHSADWLAKNLSLYFMTTAISNFMPSLGCKSGAGVLTNVVALGILVITILVDIWIQTFQIKDLVAQQNINAVSSATFFMLLMLGMIIASAISIPVSRRNLESKLQEIQGGALKEEATKRRARFTIDKQTIDDLKKYWIAAETGNPQFVAARSICCVTSGVICLLSDITVIVIYVKWFQLQHSVSLGLTKSTYGEFTRWIVVVQSIGIVVGTIAPIFRWFTAVRFKFLETIRKTSLKSTFQIEPHWIETLVHWRDCLSTFQIRDGCGFKKYVYDAKWFILTVFIGLQVSLILLSKLLLLCSIFLASPLFLSLDLINRFRTQKSSNPRIGIEIDEADLSQYVVFLDGEEEFPVTTLSTICWEADRLIQKGKAEQPRKLLCFLSEFKSFIGVTEFDSKRVPSLHSQEPLNCWTLPLVTLTCIAAALPNVSDHKIMELISVVNEGIYFTRLIDQALDANHRLMNIRKAADMGWSRVAVYRKWQGISIDLGRTSSKFNNRKEMLQKVSSTAEFTVVEFIKDATDFLMKNPLNWPVDIILANSMYRISRTILISNEEDDEEPTDDELFQNLSKTIAGILASSLTNLVTVIFTMCHCNAIETREENLRKGFFLVGKAEQICEILQEYEWPFMDQEKGAFIHEWCDVFRPDNNV